MTPTQGLRAQQTEATRVAEERERVDNYNLIHLERNVFRIQAYYRLPTLFQIPSSLDANSLRLYSSMVYLMTGMELRHLLSIQPWASGS